MLSAEVETLAREIAGEGANHEQRELAARIAEAQIDLIRVRRARHDLLARAHSNPDYQSPADDAMRMKIVKRLLRTAPDKPIPDEYRELFGALQGPDQFAAILSDLAFSYGSLRAPRPLAAQICDPRARCGTGLS